VVIHSKNELPASVALKVTGYLQVAGYSAMIYRNDWAMRESM
jgi:hypothetical protein